MRDEARGQLKRNTRLIPLLVGLLLALQLVVPYRGWVLLLIGLGGSWLGSYFWARSLVRGLQLRREMRFGWAQVGDQLEERFTLTNHSWLPALWVEVADHSSMPGYEASRVTGIGGSAENQWLTHGRCTRRGLFTLGSTSLRSGDPLGLYQVELHYPASTTLMVTPPIIPLPAIEVAPGGRSGDGRPQPHASERTVGAAGVREYQPGDSTRWIHWPSSARREGLHVRLFDGAPVGDWYLVLDLDRQVQLGLGPDATEEHAVVLAASLADRGLRQGRSVGLIAHGDELVWLPPGRGDSQRLRILRSLALIAPGAHRLAELLERSRPLLTQQASLVLITSSLDAGWLDPLLALQRRGAVATVLLLEPRSFGSQHDSSSGVAGLLSQLGIRHYLISRELLDRPEAHPGQQGHWQWRTLATGRVVARRQPQDAGWKVLQ